MDLYSWAWLSGSKNTRWKHMHIHVWLSGSKNTRSTYIVSQQQNWCSAEWIFLNYPFSVLPGGKKPNFAEQIAEQTASRTKKLYAQNLCSLRPLYSSSSLWQNPTRSATTTGSAIVYGTDSVALGTFCYLVYHTISCCSHIPP
jgi:hypothetical protein